MGAGAPVGENPRPAGDIGIVTLAPDNLSMVIELIRDNPLAILASAGVERPYLTHLPAILADPVPDSGALSGARIFGHCWQALAPSGSRSLELTGD